MVGMPLFSGFVSKLLFAQASIGHAYKMLPALIVLGISTILNAIYFMKTVIRIFVPERRSDCEVITIKSEKTYAADHRTFYRFGTLRWACCPSPLWSG